jgi:hypothetical protein
MLRAFFLLLAALVLPASAISFSKEFGLHELYAEFDDPYYVSTGFYFSLVKSGIPTLDTVDEWPVYKNLFANWYRPNCFVLEAGVAPLPLLGVAAKYWGPNYYKKAALGDVNIINAMTESVDFKEPGAFSAFFGHMLCFKDSGNSSIQGTANIGLLSSFGYYQIKNNELIDDYWGEFEAKTKVTKKGSERQYANSYRIGTRLHSQHDIRDRFYISLNRERTDFVEKGFSLIRNTNAHVRCDLSYNPLQVLSVFVEAGKKYPVQIKKHAFIFGLSLGLTLNHANPYSGALAAGFIPDSFSPSVRPLITF